MKWILGALLFITGAVSAQNSPEPIDLGLSVKWCINSSSPSAFMWADTVTVENNQGVNPVGYSWDEYPYSLGDQTKLTKYVPNEAFGAYWKGNRYYDNLTELEPEDDWVTRHYGVNYRLATYTEAEELCHTYFHDPNKIKINDRYVEIITPNRNRVSINWERRPYLTWTSTLNSELPYQAYCLAIGYDTTLPQNEDRRRLFLFSEDRRFAIPPLLFVYDPQPEAIPSGVKNSKANPNILLYDTQGHLIYEGKSIPSIIKPGMYIKIQNGKSRKIII